MAGTPINLMSTRPVAVGSLFWPPMSHTFNRPSCMRDLMLKPLGGHDMTNILLAELLEDGRFPGVVEA